MAYTRHLAAQIERGTEMKRTASGYFLFRPEQVEEDATSQKVLHPGPGLEIENKEPDPV